MAGLTGTLLIVLDVINGGRADLQGDTFYLTHHHRVRAPPARRGQVKWSGFLLDVVRDLTGSPPPLKRTRSFYNHITAPFVFLKPSVAAPSAAGGARRSRADGGRKTSCHARLRASFLFCCCCDAPPWPRAPPGTTDDH